MEYRMYFNLKRVSYVYDHIIQNINLAINKVDA